MTRSVLLLLGSNPFDPASGAARSMRTICEMLAAAGMRVRALATTACAHASAGDAPGDIANAGVDGVERVPFDGGAYFRFAHRGVSYALLDAGAMNAYEAERVAPAALDALLADALRDESPEIVFTYGGSPTHRTRLRTLRERGVIVVFGLRNLGYLDARAFEHVDAVLTPSEFLSRRYKREISIDSTPIPTPIDLEDVLAPERESVFVTFVNPSPEKGLIVVVRLCEELGARRPDIPVLVVESRGDAGRLVGVGLHAGFDLRRHKSIMFAHPTQRPRDLYAHARLLVAPSLWDEPSGRVGAEAMLNGVPPVVSDRGGLPETISPRGGPKGGGGFALGLPARLTPTTDAVPDAREVCHWLDVIERACDDERWYAQACERAAAAGRMYRPEVIAPRYVEFFEGVTRRA